MENLPLGRHLIPEAKSYREKPPWGGGGERALYIQGAKKGKCNFYTS